MLSRLDLVLGAEDMRVVLGEGAHAHDAVQRARRLVAVAGAELGHAQRQVAIGIQPLAEDLHMAGAVHRLQGEDALLRRGREHVLAELLPMARGLPQRAVDELRRAHLDIAGPVEAPAHIALDGAEQRPALGMPEHRARRLFLQMEQVQLAPEAAVVALLRLLQHVEIGFELLLVRPAGAVDALELRVLGIAAPIGARHLRQLEGVAELAGRGQMRAGAEIEKPPWR